MRKTITVAVPFEGRDNGKQFELTEFAAVTGEAWAIKALNALQKSGFQIPEEMFGLGLEALTYYSLNALIRVGAETDLMNELLSCVKAVPDPKNPNFKRPLFLNGIEGDDIEDIKTIIWLKGQVIDLNLGFSFSADLWERLRLAQTRSSAEITPTSPAQ